VVGGQAYSLHFDERVFPQPHIVDPLRWVRPDNATGKYVNREDIPPEMNSHYFPFSMLSTNLGVLIFSDIFCYRHWSPLVRRQSAGRPRAGSDNHHSGSKLPYPPARDCDPQSNEVCLLAVFWQLFPRWFRFTEMRRSPRVIALGGIRTFQQKLCLSYVVSC